MNEKVGKFQGGCWRERAMGGCCSRSGVTIAAKRRVKAPEKAEAARILFSRIKNERLG
ncbi:MAG: hypothetical protein SFV51_17325 [Bryobacteraceae bacterium]|nr:hypothetical protein [Bryobacteraceae bacterium]